MKLVRRLHFRTLTHDALSAFRRFPLPVLLSVFTTVVLLLAMHDVIDLATPVCRKTLNVSALVFLYAIAVTLYAESRPLRAYRREAGLVVGCLMLAGSVFLVPFLIGSQLLLTAALLLAICVAPYVNRPSDDPSFWRFNYLALSAVVFAILSCVVLCGGVSAILVSIGYLFEFTIGHKVYADLWIVGSSLFLPVYILSQLPRQFDFARQDCPVPQGVHFLVNYLLVPLSLAYMAVLYCYFVKIVLQWNLPRGNLAHMITSFGSFGVLTFLVMEPLQETGTRLLRWFRRYFYAGLFVPLSMLALGIFVRVQDYGLTGQRYFIVLLLVWLTSLAILFTVFRRRARLKHVPLILAALLLFAAVGPFSCVNLSARSQLHRLEDNLRQVGVLQPDGTIRPMAATPNAAPGSKSSEIKSGLDYLYGNDQLARVKPWVTLSESELRCDNRGMFCSTYAKDSPVDRIMREWNVSSQSDRDDGTLFAVRLPMFSGRNVFETKGYDYSVKADLGAGVAFVPDNAGSAVSETPAVRLLLRPDGFLEVVLDNSPPILFDMHPFLQDVYKNVGSMQPQDAAILQKQEQGWNVKVQLFELIGRTRDGQDTLSTGSMMVLFKKTDT